MVVKIVNRNGQPQLDVKQTSVDVGDLDISFSGDILAPIAEAIVNMMDEDIKDIVQKAVIENVRTFFHNSKKSSKSIESFKSAQISIKINILATRRRRFFHKSYR